MAATYTYQQIADAIQDAIYALVSGGAVQDYSIGGKRLTKYSLKELEDLRAKYQSLADANARGGSVTYASFKRIGQADD